MKTSIISFLILGIFTVGCGPTLYVTETNTKEINEKLINYQKDGETGVNITLLLRNGENPGGELLSVRDSSIIVCAKYSATEEELSNLQFPISSIETNEIIELEIKGNSYPLWIGAGIGLVAGTTTFILVKDDIRIHIGSSSEEKVGDALGSCCLVVSITVIPTLIGRMLSTEDVILSDIPPGYKFLPLKSLARYPDEEPDYLKAID